MDLNTPWRLEYCDGWYVVDKDNNGVCDIGGFGVTDEEDERLYSIGVAIEALPKVYAALKRIDAVDPHIDDPVALREEFQAMRVAISIAIAEMEEGPL